jgi:hypothetical protein
MDYNEKNLKLVIGVIKRNLTPDLLPKKWIERNNTNPMFGHCHTSSACLQKIFGSKNIKLWRGLDDEGIWHWWAVDLEGKLIDITADQYTSQGRKPPYDVGEKSSMLGFDYRTRVLTLLDKVTKELSSNGTPPM